MLVHHQREITRRSILGQTASTAAGLALSIQTSSLFAKGSLNKPAPGTGPSYGASRRVAQLMTLDAVKLRKGPFRDAMDRNGACTIMDGSDLTKSFRQTAALEFSAKGSLADTPIRFWPLAFVTRDRYSVYWKMT